MIYFPVNTSDEIRELKKASNFCPIYPKKSVNFLGEIRNFKTALAKLDKGLGKNLEGRGNRFFQEKASIHFHHQCPDPRSFETIVPPPVRTR